MKSETKTITSLIAILPDNTGVIINCEPSLKELIDTSLFSSVYLDDNLTNFDNVPIIPGIYSCDIKYTNDLIITDNSYEHDALIWLENQIKIDLPLISNNINESYLKKINITVEKKYNVKYGDDKICKCGHPYYRHFDTYEDMSVIGCKYCACFYFKEK